MTLRYIYLVMSGDFHNGEIVGYEPVCAFRTRREAERLVQIAKQEDPYLAQYDKVERVKVRPWRRG